jgi:hypothetical protein
MNTADYFATARERYNIKLRREAGLPEPWSEDPVLQKFRFCHVHREDDKTTQWFRDNIRSKFGVNGTLDEQEAVKLVESTLIFRWFNRIETGEIIKDLLVEKPWDSTEARARLLDVKPLITGAFMIKTPTGMSKLDGLLYSIDRAIPKLPVMIESWGTSLRLATEDLGGVNGLGPFLSYEITTDLRHTPLLNEATDIMTWANAGPGCTHGLGRLFGDPWKWKRSNEMHQAEMCGVMQAILAASRDPNNWPAEWPQWEMRTVEHWSCEYDKWCRGVAGDHLKRRFR